MGANKKVMKIVIAVLALCLLALAQTPPRPNFSEQFSANIGLDVKTPTGHFYGEGTVAYDYTGGRAMEALHYNNATMDPSISNSTLPPKNTPSMASETAPLALLLEKS